MNTIRRSLIFSAAPLVAYVLWLLHTRWNFLHFSDLSIILAIALCAAAGVFCIFALMLRSVHLRPMFGVRASLLSVPLVGSLGWFVVMALATKACVHFALSTGTEDGLNNAVQFIWSRSDFMYFVFFALFFSAAFLASTAWVSEAHSERNKRK